MADLPPPLPITTQEVRIVDAEGRPRILLSAKEGVPIVVLMREDGQRGASLALDSAGRPAVKLANSAAGGPVAALEVGDKGAHVKFDGPGAATSYLFLNNLGSSGVILIDKAGCWR